MRVLVALSSAPDRVVRFSELAAEVRGISHRMLSATLRSLERDGIVTRTLYAEVPPRVEYSLSDRGNRLLGPVAALVSWVKREVPAIETSRVEHDLRYGKPR